MPVPAKITTMIIMPSSRPIVLKSIERTANSKLSVAENRLVVIPIMIAIVAPI